MTTQPSDWAVELLPCPFCGSRDVTVGGLIPWVECDNCGMSGPQKITDAEAIAAWNTRAPVARELDASGGAVPMDKGPWRADDDGKRVHSEDFAVDAMLTIGGDFIDDHHRKDYAVWLARTLNGATPRAAEAGEPDMALLISMATCLNHGFGLLDSMRQQSMLRDMRKLLDEVQGRGYYRPDRAGWYMSMLNPIKADAQEAAMGAVGAGEER